MKALLIALSLTALIPIIALGETMKHDHKLNGSMQGMMTEGALPHETGQAAFAAIQEIVAMLNANPATDWSKVDIEALRQHLIDMNNVTLGAVVTTQPRRNSIQFHVSGEGAVIQSIKRMIVAHASTMNGIDGWTYVAKPFATGANIIVTPPDAASIVKLHALGFIGIMSIGMHHQQHHWMLANGKPPH